MKGKQVLGRGLDALINPTRTDTIPAYPQFTENIGFPDSITKLLIAAIEPNPFQPRKSFHKEALEELKNSIRANGLIQPITVRKVEGDKYQIVSGERRWRAMKELGETHVPAYVLEVASNEMMLEMALIENLQREDLNPVEIAKAYQQLMDECSLTQEQVALKVGKERSTVSNMIRLLKLPGEIQNSLIDGTISMGHARALLNMPLAAHQTALWKQILDKQLSVREVERLAKIWKDSREHAETRPSRESLAKPQDPALRSVQEDLQRILGTRVHLNQTKNGKGTIVIEFYSNDDFDRLVEMFHASGR